MYFISLRARSATDVNAPRAMTSRDLPEPDLNLIQPPRIRGGEMELHSRILLEKLLNRFRLVSGKVIEHDVDLLCGGRVSDDVAQEADKVCTGVAC